MVVACFLRAPGALALALVLSVPVAAQVPEAPAPAVAEPEVELIERLDLEQDHSARLTVPVSIDGRGPFDFIVDTGAERTVISRELAQRLGLDAGPTATVHSMTEASQIRTVVIPELEVGRRTLSDIHAPALDRHDLGAAGMLGVDALRSQRIEFDFVLNEMRVTPSRREEAHWPRDTIVVTAKRRYGHLILVDSSFDGEPIQVIIDTGSQVTVANDALRRRLARRDRLGPLRPVPLLSVTGGQTLVQYGIAHNIRIGDAVIRNLPIAFADVHPFHQLHLSRHPAILLGMDALQLFERVSIDFANRRVRMLPRPSSRLDSDWQLASAAAP